MASRSLVSVFVVLQTWWLLLRLGGRHTNPVCFAVASATVIVADGSPTKDFGAKNNSFLDPAITKQTSGKKTHQLDGTTKGRHRKHPFLLGVMVDAGRHEFSVDWIRSFMESIHKMGFNTLHLTLSNDQRFAFTTTTNVTLENRTQKPYGTASPDSRFTTGELRSLAQHALSLDNMTIIPEVSLPFFAASWAGTIPPPPCPRYICSQERTIATFGTNLPLDIRHPRIPDVLRTALSTLVDGLQQPAHLHLGASSRIRDAHYGCWGEVLENSDSAGEASPPDYEGFEKTLAGILTEDLGYQPRIIRTYADGDGVHEAEAGSSDTLMYQDYENLPPFTQQIPSPHSYWLQPKELNLATNLIAKHRTGWNVYKETMKLLCVNYNNYEDGSFEGMIVSTEALPLSWFEERNVIGRLLAISMAVRNFEECFEQFKEGGSGKNCQEQTKYVSKEEFDTAYRVLCDNNFPQNSAKDSVCDRLGGLNIDPTSPLDKKNLNDPEMRKILQQETVIEGKYKRSYSKMWKRWAEDICHRLTEKKEELKLQTPVSSITEAIRDEAFSSYWRHLNNEDRSSNEKEWDRAFVTEKQANIESLHERNTRGSILAHELFAQSKVPFGGFILDLVDDTFTFETLTDLMENIMAPLGLNTLQLSLINHHGCSLQLDSLEGLYHLVPKPSKSITPLTDRILQQIVAVGDRLGMELIPEISITTQAAGWYHAGFLVDCPITLCSPDPNDDTVGGAISNDVNHGSLLPVILKVIQKLREIFRSGSFLHLGSDERDASKPCWTESGRTPDYDRFERVLSTLLEAKNWYNNSNILRWENQEGIFYPKRTGKITQYRYGSYPERKLSQTATRMGQPDDHKESGAFVFGSLTITLEKDPWTIYQETRKWITIDGVSPRGLHAKIRMKDLENNPNHLKACILAFAIGLSSEAPILSNPSSLNAYVLEICSDKNLYYCPSASNVEVGRTQNFGPPRGQILCKAMTKTASRPVMRSHGLADSSLLDDGSAIEES